MIVSRSMKKLLLFFFAFSMLTSIWGQSPFTWTALSNMPVPVTNNAVAEGTVLGVRHVYSFAGIDTTKAHAGIHLHAYRYNTQTDLWDVLPDVPDTLGKIAVGASTVKNKIYLIGGYHVFANGNEVSSSKVHIFDPETNTFLPDGATIPKPIDDQVQAVWRDSLIFVVTGWSNTGNVRDVQIYDPENDAWQAGTPVPSTQGNYAAFGASGTIIGDTIFYYGGAKSSFNFSGTSLLRKGIIDPTNPTNIVWNAVEFGPRVAYRSASFNYENRAFWLGGSEVTYNYNGIAYSNGAPVEPAYSIVSYRVDNGNFSEWMEPNGVMDLRGIAQIDNDTWVVAGGMEDNQQVSARTFLIDFDTTYVTINEEERIHFAVEPNPVRNVLHVSNVEWLKAVIVSLDGRIIETFRRSSPTIDVADLASGTYFLRVSTKEGVGVRQFIKH